MPLLCISGENRGMALVLHFSSVHLIYIFWVWNLFLISLEVHWCNWLQKCFNSVSLWCSIISVWNSHENFDSCKLFIQKYCGVLDNLEYFSFLFNFKDKFIKISRSKPVLNPKALHLENVIMKICECQHSLDIL